MKIHSTAVIHPSAEIADDVEIGPHACVEGRAVIGPGCVIQAHAILAGNVRIGRENQIGYGAIIGADPQDLGFKKSTPTEVRIGNRNVIREYCTIHRATREGGATEVGDDCFLMAGSHLGHDVRISDSVIIANNVLMGGHVEVQDRAFIGGGTAFHQHIRVGRLAVVQGNSAFSKDIPPFTLAAERNTVVGLNVVGMRRAGFTAVQREEVKQAFKLLYKSGLNTTQAIEKAQLHHWNQEGRTFFDFVAAAKKRGIADLLETVRSWREEPDVE
jgi:UDP-N-acetylglucosamine acyltransferase